MPVQIEYNENAVAHGYTVGHPSVYPQQVEVTGARSEVEQIDQIVAKVVLPSEMKHDYERQVNLIALDRKKRQLNVVIEPATAKVTIPVSVAHKRVRVKLEPKNEQSGKIYSLTAKPDYITIYGAKEDLAKISKLKVPVDLSEVAVSTSKVVKLDLPTGVVKSDPVQLGIDIKVANSNVKREKN